MAALLRDLVTKLKLDLATAKQRLADAEREAVKQEVAYRCFLPVSQENPCCVGVLPDGSVVVHVWVESCSEQNQLHIVKAGYMDFDGKGRRPNPENYIGEDPDYAV